MGWFDRYVWRRQVEQREQLTLDQLLAEQGAPTAAGEPVTTDSAMRLSAVWACVRLLSDAVSSLPVHVYRQGERDPLPTLPPVLQQPAAGTPLHDWLYMLMVSLTLRGNGFGRIVARSGGAMLPSQIELAHPDRWTVTVNRDGLVEHRLNGELLDPAEVFHVRGYSFPGSVVGLSPVAYARETVGLGLAAERFGARWFGDGAMPSGVIYPERDPGEAGAKKLQAQWVQARSGNRRPAVLHGAKFEPIAVAPEESQFVEAQQLNVASIARIFGIPGEMVGGQTAGPLAYTSPEMRSLDFLTYTVRPWLVRLEAAMSSLLPRRQVVKFNPDAIVRVDLKTRYEAHEIGIRAGFLRRNEARELENREPIAGLDDRPPEPPGAVA